jgi:hypothetical protein
MDSFYHDDTFQIEGAYGRYDAKQIEYLMYNLPTLFAYLEEHNIKKLHLCCTTSYGGYNSTLQHFFIKEEAKLFCEDLLELLSKNTTLVYCNLGLFRGMLTNEELEEAVALHPSLTCVSMNAPRATTDFRAAPTTLYRDKEEVPGQPSAWKMYWAHFRAV